MCFQSLVLETEPEAGSVAPCVFRAWFWRQSLWQAWWVYVFSEPGSGECNPLNMSIEAELVIEQLKEQHHRDLCHLRLELEDKVSPAFQSDGVLSACERSCCFFLTDQHSCAFLLELRGCQEPGSSV